jgi:hypothetical protein
MPSQAIRAFAYDADRNELTVTFTTGRAYIYALVPPAVAQAFADCGSKGAFHNVHIRDRYPFRKLSGAVTRHERLSLREALMASTDEESVEPAMPSAKEG